MSGHTPTTGPVEDPAAPGTAFARFLTAIGQDDDEATETTVATLDSADEWALIALAADEDNDRRWWAVRALAAVGSARGADALALAASDADPSVRAVVALGFGHLYPRAPEAVAAQLPALASLLQDNDGFVRQAAVDGLSLCGESALPVLQQILLEGTHEGARSRAAAALRAMRSMKAAPLLFRILNDRNPLVHTYAREALDDLGLLDNLLLMP